MAEKVSILESMKYKTKLENKVESLRSECSDIHKVADLACQWHKDHLLSCNVSEREEWNTSLGERPFARPEKTFYAVCEIVEPE